jgi:hypothetical protein
MRWPCGPLALAREQTRAGTTARDLAALRRFSEPASLDVLKGRPVSALVVPWAEGDAADADQPTALGSLVAAARSRGLAVVGHVGDKADLRRAAGAASAAGLDAIVTESDRPVEGVPALRFRPRGVAGLRPGLEFFGDADAVWPGMRPLKRGGPGDVDAVSGATSRPWIDSNAWYVRLVRALAAPGAIWLGFEPPADGRPLAAEAYVQALADTEAAGGRWVLSLDRNVRNGLAEDQAAARDTWDRISRALLFFRGHAGWRAYRAVAQIGVVSDFAGGNEFVSHELLNLLARRSALFTAVPKATLSAAALDGLDAVVYFDEDAPEPAAARTLDAFAEAGGTLIVPAGWKAKGPAAPARHPRFALFRAGEGRVAVARGPVDDPERLAEDAELIVSHRRDRVRLYNVAAGQYHYATSADGRHGVLHLISYPSPYPPLPVAAWFRRPWTSARVWKADGSDAAPVPRVEAAGGVEFHVPPAPTYWALEVAG